MRPPMTFFERQRFRFTYVQIGLRDAWRCYEQRDYRRAVAFLGFTVRVLVGYHSWGLM